MTRRRAFTLIELLVAMSLFAVILPVSGWLIYVLLHAQTASANSIADALTRSRFARTFRADAHAALSSEVSNDGSAMGSRAVFHLDPSTLIRYETQTGGVVVRSVEVGHRVDRREEFRFLNTQTRFEQQSGQGTIAAVQSQLTPSAAQGSPKSGAIGTVSIEAVTGRDRRFLGPPTAESKEKG